VTLKKPSVSLKDSSSVESLLVPAVGQQAEANSRHATSRELLKLASDKSSYSTKSNSVGQNKNRSVDSTSSSSLKHQTAESISKPINVETMSSKSSQNPIQVISSSTIGNKSQQQPSANILLSSSGHKSLILVVVTS